MNIISVTVSAGMMGMLLPGVMTISIAPTVTSIRSNNFATAEAQVVAYAAKANISYEAHPTSPTNASLTTTRTQQRSPAQKEMANTK